MLFFIFADAIKIFLFSSFIYAIFSALFIISSNTIVISCPIKSSFIISFAEKFKKTTFFLFAGGLLIYIVNLFRIAILTIMYYEFPEYQETLHNIVFPAIIYGMVLLLWMIWVRMLPKTNTGNE